MAILLITFNGLPAHPLIVHGAVVFGPLAVLAALGYLVPRWRGYLRWPLLVTAVLAFAFIWASYLTGDNFKDSQEFYQTNPQVLKHEDYADVLRWVTTAFALVVVVVTGWLHRRTGAVRLAAGGVMGALAVVTLVYIFLTGEAGAKAVYPPSAAALPVVSTR